jgi:Transposase DDE domain
MHIPCPKLFDPEIQVNRKIKRALVRYLGGLILYSGKKNCSAIAKATSVSHDIVYDFFECHDDGKSILQDFLKKTLCALPLQRGNWYINIDETMIDKMFSEKIEAVAYNWNSTFNDTMKGYSIVAAVITNGKITIPITFKTWHCAKDFPNKHKTRIELAQMLMIEIQAMAPEIMFLMDGAFSSAGMISFCRTHKMKYCMRFHSNKKVVINGQVAQIREHQHIKISSNKRSRVVNGYYKGEEVFIVAFKRKEKKGSVKIVYLVTNEKESPKKTISAYKKRWGIEKVFRTTKQHLGLRDCQARSASKQEIHIFAVFVAYAFLEIQKINRKAKNPEQILHKIRHYERGKLHVQFETFCGEA